MMGSVPGAARAAPFEAAGGKTGFRQTHEDGSAGSAIDGDPIS